ncbi:hypothetical protein F5880DRAFT_337722 [Lentinula raphanica]|nr:hypothetical protein F5880DRAFT_337722 [Lentinula raphanica]
MRLNISSVLHVFLCSSIVFRTVCGSPLTPSATTPSRDTSDTESVSNSEASSDFHLILNSSSATQPTSTAHRTSIVHRLHCSTNLGYNSTASRGSDMIISVSSFTTQEDSSILCPGRYIVMIYKS